MFTIKQHDGAVIKGSSFLEGSTIRKEVGFNGTDWGGGTSWQRRQLEQSGRDVTRHGEFWLRNLVALIERCVWGMRRLGSGDRTSELFCVM